MPLGRSYDWGAAISDWERSLRTLSSNLRKQNEWDFFDYFLSAAPMIAQFIPGLGPLAKFGIGSGLEALGDIKRGQLPRLDWKTLWQLAMPKAEPTAKEEWLNEQQTEAMKIATGQGPGTGLDALNPFGQTLFEEATGLKDINWSGYGMEANKIAEREGAVAAEKGLQEAFDKLGIPYTPQVVKSLSDMLGVSAMETIVPGLYQEKAKVEKPTAEEPTAEEKKYAEYQEFLKLDSAIRGGLANPEDIARHRYLKSQSHIAATLKGEKRNIAKEVDSLRDAAERIKKRYGRNDPRVVLYEKRADELEDKLVESQTLMFGGTKVPTGTGMGEFMKQVQPQEIGAPEIPGLETKTQIPPKLQTILDKYKSFDEWYDTLTANQRNRLTPEEEQLIRAYYGTF